MFFSDWPPNIEYSAGYTTALKPARSLREAASDSTSTHNYMSAYKDKKSGGEPSPLASGNNSSSSSNSVEQEMQVEQQVEQKDKSGRQVQRPPGEKSRRRRPQQVIVNKGNILGLKQLVIKDRNNPNRPVGKGGRKISRPQADHAGISLKGVATERKPMRKSSNERKRPENKSPSLYERYQASHSGRKQKKMYGLSICDVYESKQTEDVFSYGLFLATPLSTPPTKQKLNPLMNIGPVNPCARDLEGH